MTSIMDKNFFNEEDDNSIVIPRDIILDQCEILNNNSGGRIIARISEYDGPYHSYTSQAGLSVMRSFGKIIGEDFNVQNVLGSAGEDPKMAYELYLTSTATPKYKYRIMIIAYDIMLYPVSIALDESIAQEIEVQTELEINNQKNFEELLYKIWGSNKVKQIVKNLIKINASLMPL